MKHLKKKLHKPSYYYVRNNDYAGKAIGYKMKIKRKKSFEYLTYSCTQAKTSCVALQENSVHLCQFQPVSINSLKAIKWKSIYQCIRPLPYGVGCLKFSKPEPEILKYVLYELQ